ncbi:protein spaetzle-like [Glossina fuscipes]|uniref:Protein spaetzle-like n=1 Tax=Glossina fuscipes TaxID=7396 RepID=A0A8U0WIF9_9MUSC|nr:protein spaetzle-like [Glossina fuscipes]
MFTKVVIFILFISKDMILWLNAKNVTHKDSIECLEWDHGFCIEMANYPNLDNIEEALIKEYPQLIMDTDDHYFIDDETELRGIVYMEPLCRSSKKIIYPQMQNTDIGWLIIVNNEKLKQGLLIEVCDDMDAPCSSIKRGSTKKPICKQVYIHSRLVAMTTTGETLTHEFQIPSCCKCFRDRWETDDI